MYNYKKEREKLINEHMEQYGYLFCSRCKKNKCGLNFHCHHIIYRSEAPNHEHLHNPKNLIILGSDCHTWIHSKKNRRNDLVTKRNLKVLFKNVFY